MAREALILTIKVEVPDLSEGGPTEPETWPEAQTILDRWGTPNRTELLDTREA